MPRRFFHFKQEKTFQNYGALYMPIIFVKNLNLYDNIRSN